MKLSTKIKCFVVRTKINIREYKKRKMAEKLGLVPCPVYVEADEENNEDQ